MLIKSLIATGAATALLVTPAWALAHGGPPADRGHGHANAHSQASHPTRGDNPGTAHRNDATPGPHASGKAKRRAYGQYCDGQSRTHVAGEHGTPFSQCVTAMARAAKADAQGKSKSPAWACKAQFDKHGDKAERNAYGKCVSAAAQLLGDRQSTDDQSADDQTSDGTSQTTDDNAQGDENTQGVTDESPGDTTPTDSGSAS